ncbi:hypothetical protein LK996_10255 [Lysobacter sp. A6]|uniref:Heme exporter protein D n=1 Tax=Noviluteimonas lactosilytica TaxID=2888523 RepID=A0ABS8JIM7_9GAMM|nr:hypothetical protein [Lysobacter lactosilyticus]MCC8363454.1 hypothetical protein [Lysobacter lactosilyticus]
MDDRTLQFALYLVIAAALYLLVVVGIVIARRVVNQWRAARHGRRPVVVGHDATRRPND